MSEKLSMNNKKRSWINQKEQEKESYPKTINFSARSLRPPPPSSPSCTQEERSILERGVQNFPNLSPTVIKPFMYPWGKWSLQKEAHILLTTSPSPLPLPPSPPQHTHIHTHTHTHAHTRMRQTPDTPLSGSQVYRKGYICYHLVHDSRGLILEQGQVCKETVVLRRWEI